jgi:hypothetical protein
MFLQQARTVTKSLQPITFFTYNIPSIPSGITSFTFIMQNPRILQAISYRRRGGHEFNFKVTVFGRLDKDSPYVQLLEAPLTPNPQTPETDLLIPEIDQAVYQEYLMLTESYANESRIAQLDIGFKQLRFLED